MDELDYNLEVKVFSKYDIFVGKNIKGVVDVIIDDIVGYGIEIYVGAGFMDLLTMK